MKANSHSNLIKLLQELTRSLDDLIKTIRGNIMISLGWTGSLVLIGIATTALFYAMSRFQSMSDLLKVGPSLLSSSLSAFQIKTIMVARERLFSYRSLRARLERSQALGEVEIQASVAEAIKALEELRKRE